MSEAMPAATATDAIVILALQAAWQQISTLEKIRLGCK